MVSRLSPRVFLAAALGAAPAWAQEKAAAANVMTPPAAKAGAAKAELAAAAKQGPQWP